MEAFGAELAAEAGAFEAAEGGAEVENHSRVERDAAGRPEEAQEMRHPMHARGDEVDVRRQRERRSCRSR